MTRLLAGRIHSLPMVTSLLLAACTTGVSPASAPPSDRAASPSAGTPWAETSSAPASSASASTEPAADRPPTATLRVGPGAQIPGDLGSFTIGAIGDDAPWLPGEPASVAAGSRIRIELERLTPDRWQAAIATAPDTDTRELAEGTGAIELPTPAAGEWSLRVRVFFPGGDATYYWALTVG
jgi:hypothetical protein